MKIVIVRVVVIEGHRNILGNVLKERSPEYFLPTYLFPDTCTRSKLTSIVICYWNILR